MLTRFIFCLLIFVSTSAFAQLPTKAPAFDTITVKRNLGTNMYYIKDVVVRPVDLKAFFDKNTQEYQYMKKANTNLWIAYGFSFAGGLLIGVQISDKFLSKTVDKNLIYAGLGLIAVGIPFNAFYNKFSLKAVKAYNRK